MKKSILIILSFFLLFSFAGIHAQIITTIVGNGLDVDTGDGSQATTASILGPWGVAVDDSGNIFISTFLAAPTKIRKVNTAGIISTFAGTDTLGFSGDGGPATNARLFNPNGIAFDKKGNVYIAEMNGNRRVRKVNTYGIITTFAGNGSSTVFGDGGPATAAGLGSGSGICSDTFGNIYIAAGDRIRKIDTAGIITTFAGTGSGIYSGDGGPATDAGIATQGQITIDRHGNMYVADNNRVRKINSLGIITTVAGNGMQGYSGDGGPATAAKLHDPEGVFLDNCDNLYIADGWNNVIRVVNGSGMIKTFAGNGFGAGSFGTGGFSGDGGQATAAELNNPNCLYMDKNGSLYISDLNNHRVRYIHMDSCTNTTATPNITNTEHGLHIFPNPSQGSFTFHLTATENEAVTVTITDLVGTTIKQLTTTTNKETEINLNVAKGMYFVNATTGRRTWVAKVMIE